VSTETIYLVVGDTYPDVELTLKDSNTGEPSDPDTWTPIDLSALTTSVRVDFRLRGSDAIVASAACSKVGSGADGKVTFLIPTEVLAAAGTYEGEIVITYAAGTETVYDKLKVKVRSR